MSTVETSTESHAATALDQLRLADDLAETREQLHASALVAAQVHATLALSEAVRTAALDPWAYAAQPRT